MDYTKINDTTASYPVTTQEKITLTHAQAKVAFHTAELAKWQQVVTDLKAIGLKEAIK